MTSHIDWKGEAFHKMEEFKFLFDQDFGYVILKHLDFKSIDQCRVVCKNWKESIENEQVWLNKQFEYILDSEKQFQMCGHLEEQGPLLPFPPRTYTLETIMRLTKVRTPLAIRFLTNLIINESIPSRFPKVTTTIKRTFCTEKALNSRF